MKAHLLHRHQDFDLEEPLPWNEEALTKDLTLNTLFNAMANGDKLVFEVAQKVIFAGLQNDVETIRFRQEILKDCLNHPAVIREFYATAVAAMEEEKKHYFSVLWRYPDWVLRYSVELAGAMLKFVKKLRKLADSHADEFVSEGWTALFATLQAELTDEYFARVEHHLEQLKFSGGVSLSAELGKGNKGNDYTLHAIYQPRRRSWEWLKWVIREWLNRPWRWEWMVRRFGRQPSVFEFTLHPRDESGAKALGEIRDRGISLVANALAQANDHVRSFFNMLRTELAFYVGCVNLHEELAQKGEPICLPVPGAPESRTLLLRGLYDVCLTLGMKRRVVGNDANADGRDLVIVTGANQGGKSTFLRSVGLAQLMMQCGMFVPAESFCSSIYDGLFTHYKREEDTSMKSGKLDEELSRMSTIIDHITPHSMILFNESFAATNEREGSEIARQIVSALLDRRVKILYVTHLYELARGFSRSTDGNALFLRAERQPSGARTFKLVEGEPLPTSFGQDLYNSIFGAPVQCER